MNNLNNLDKKSLKNKQKLIKNELKTKKTEHKNEEKRVKNFEELNKKNNAKNAKSIIQLNKKPKGRIDLVNSSKDSIIDLNGVSKIYANRSNSYVAIDNVNLTINRGEFVVILGPSGSGKTSLLNIISGLDRPTYGEAIIDNQNIAALNDRDLTTFRRKNIGFIFQSYNLISSLNVYDNIQIGQSLQTDNNKRFPIDELLEIIGMQDQKKKRIYQLSGGQQQRVSIARALAKGPKILIGDEPTGALDVNTSNSVLKLFQEINKKFKTTVIVVTHNDEITKLANRVIRVVDGKITSVVEQVPGIL